MSTRSIPSMAFVDDHLVLAELLASAMTQGGFDATALAPDHDLVVEQARQRRFDIAVLDMDLGADRPPGMELIGPFRAAGSRVLMLTGGDESLDHARCYREGASAVLSKAQSFSSLVEQLETAARGPQPADSAEARRLIAELERHEAQQQQRLAPFGTLTPREEEILEGISIGLNATELAERDYVSLATVRSQVRSILSKLGAHSQLAAVAAAREAGWRPRP